MFKHVPLMPFKLTPLAYSTYKQLRDTPNVTWLTLSANAKKKSNYREFTMQMEEETYYIKQAASGGMEVVVHSESKDGTWRNAKVHKFTTVLAAVNFIQAALN